MKILGIDPGLSQTGIAIFSQGEEGFKISWKTLRHKKGNGRLYKYFEALLELIQKEKPDKIVIESIFHGPSVETLIKIAELRGVYLLLAEMKKLPILEFTPREIKQSVTGSGASSKEQVRFMVKKILGINEQISFDVSDAFAAIICYLNKVCLNQLRE
ncbi:MAG: crossover junction endodeoxyribonuclease RuvC [candidate division WOR-3 bacterium]